MPNPVPMSTLISSICLLALVLGCSMASDTTRPNPAQPETAGLTPCPEPRPEICAQIYLPVCAETLDGKRKTYASGCTACTDPQVTGYRDGECPADQ